MKGGGEVSSPPAKTRCCDYAARRSESFADGKFRSFRFSSSADIDAAFRCRIARKRLLNVGTEPRSPNPSFWHADAVVSAGAACRTLDGTQGRAWARRSGICALRARL